MKINEFIEEVKKMGINLNDRQLTQLEEYCDYLIEYNKTTNLTAITNKEDIYLKHFYDSITLTKAVGLSRGLKVIDIGAGAGFPGVVLKIINPEIQLTLLDSNNKKTKFLGELTQKLELANVEIVNARAEEYAINHMGEFDLCTSRAVASIDIITSLSSPLIKLNGTIALMKGNLENELPVLEKHSKELNVKEFNIVEVNPIGGVPRNIVVIKKIYQESKASNYSKLVKRNKLWMKK